MRHTKKPLSVLISAALLAAPGFVWAADAAPAVVASVKQPWRNAQQPPEVRAAHLLQAMTFEQKVALVSAVDPREYAPLAALGIPAFTRVDASGGLRGDRGQTAFPVPLALAASFDTQLAAEYGTAIAVEARGKSWNTILGPTVDVARDLRSGRLTESFGEEPLMNARFGVAVAKGMQSQNVIAMAKHFTAYNTERDRTTMDIRASARTLHEIYNLPFEDLVHEAKIASVMGSYPKLNGTYVLQSKTVLDMLKQGMGFKGYVATDFMAGDDGVAQFNAGVDSWSLQPFLRKADAFKAGAIPAERLDDAVRRTLWSLFSSGLFDRPVDRTPAATVTTPKHQALAQKTAESSIVLLKNDGGVLPLKRKGSLAVVGPAGKDVVTGVMWSSYVDPGHFKMPLDAISEAAGPKVKVVHSQGSIGDFTLPSLGLGDGSNFGPPTLLATKSGKPGWDAEFFANDKRSGEPTARAIVREVDVTASPHVDLPQAWSARWSTKLTPLSDGLVRLAANLSGTVKVTVDGQVVLEGMRSTATNFNWGGPFTYPVQGVTRLKAGKPVDIVVEYATTGTFTGPRIQLGWQPNSLIADAVAAAKQADTAVVFVNQVTGEVYDRDNLDLPGDQNELVAAVAEANPNTVVVLNTGGPVKMPWLPKVKGVVQLWYPGSAIGTSLARVLFGDADPGGRLPVTFPADESQLPKAYVGGGSIDYSEGVFVGYRYLQQQKHTPLFPFGHGLSYGTFTVSGLKAQPLSAGDAATQVSAQVKNIGTRAGSTVVQVYGGPLPTSEATPSRLLGFAKVQLAPGEARTVTIPVARRELSLWDEGANKWVTPAGEVPVRLGFSSADTPLRASIAVR